MHIKYEDIQGYRYVSFDIFDTAIVRNVACPEHVFDLVELYYKAQYTGKKGIVFFALKRRLAEILLRKINKKEVSLNDIYYLLSYFYDKKIIDRYMSLEKDLEIKISECRRDVYDLYKKCIENSQKVIFTSDMYLPKDVIISILHKAGYTNYEHIYISQEVGHTKSSGDIYPYILKELNISSAEIVHMGDNRESDLIQANENNIKAYLIDRKEYKKEKNVVDEMYKSEIINLKDDKENSASFEYGYSKFGPFIKGYVNWLNSCFVRGNYDTILFFSREGFFIKKAFETLKFHDFNINYFYASRQALGRAYIGLVKDYKSSLDMMFIPRCFSLRWLLKKWTINVEDVNLVEFGLAEDEELNKFDIYNDKRVERLFYALRDTIIENSERERKAFYRYFDEVNNGGKKIAIVDIGWNGNMQKSFARLLQNHGNYLIEGFYVGVFTDSGNHKIQKMNSYIKDSSGYADFIKDYYAHTLLELLFTAPHGSLKKYVEQDGYVELAAFEYEKTFTYENIKQIQEGALRYLEKHNDIKSELTFGSEKNLMRSFCKPSKNDLEVLGNMYAWDDGWIPMAEKKSGWYYMTHLKEFKRDLLGNSWKLGFLKRNFVLIFPYKALLKVLRFVAMKK